MAGETREQQQAPDEEGTPSEERELHTMLWSAFAARRLYDTQVLKQRYQLYSPEFAARFLLKKCDNAPEAPREAGKAIVEWWLCQVGLWAAAARIEELGNNEDAVRRQISKQFGFEFASMRQNGIDRLLVPDMFELGIANVSVRTESFYAGVRVRLEAHVARPFHVLRDAVCPSHWSLCPFWRNLPQADASDPNWYDGPKSITPNVWLPGGSLEKPDKSRPVGMNVELSRSAFQTRIDYEGEDLGTPGRNEPVTSEKPGRREIGRFGGFLLVEKLEGRPGWCRMVFDRQATFGHVNHNFLSKETLWYWLASDLIGLVVRTPREIPVSGVVSNPVAAPAPPGNSPAAPAPPADSPAVPPPADSPTANPPGPIAPPKPPPLADGILPPRRWDHEILSRNRWR